MEAYEKDFYKAKNLVGCVWGTRPMPRILCFKDLVTHAIGRIVLYKERDSLEAVGRSVVFADPTHSREIIHNPFSTSQLWLHVERIGKGNAVHTLYTDHDQFESLSWENRAKLAPLIDEQQNLMEGQVKILKLALDMFEQGADVIPPNISNLHRAIIIKSHQYIINSNPKGFSLANEAIVELRHALKDAPQIGLQGVIPVLASSYLASELHTPYGKDPEPSRLPIVEAKFSGSEEQEERKVHGDQRSFTPPLGCMRINNFNPSAAQPLDRFTAPIVTQPTVGEPVENPTTASQDPRSVSVSQEQGAAQETEQARSRGLGR